MKKFNININFFKEKVFLVLILCVNNFKELLLNLWFSIYPQNLLYSLM